MAVVIYCIIAFIVIYIINYYRNVSKYPKGPIPLPLLGNLLMVDHGNLHNYLADLSKTYGPIYSLFMPSPTVVITDYEYLKEAYVKQGENFSGRTNRPPDNLLQKFECTGVLWSDGEVWKENRRASLKILKDFGLGKKLMEEQIIGSIREMLTQLRDTEDKKCVDLYLSIQLCVGNVINENLFGYHYSYKNAQKFEEFVAILSKHVQLKRGNPCLQIVQTYPWLKCLPIIGHKGYYAIRENIDSYQKFMEKEVNELMAKYDPHHEPENFVHAYMREMEQTKGNTTLNKTNLIATCIDFWMAGMETTSVTLRWAIIYMLQNPGVQEKVRSEIIKQIGNDRLPTMNDRQSMPYTQAMLYETQRFANLVATPPTHRCKKNQLKN
ncbi:hypothetical protein WR25_23815 [Diploscapter pachys]|uniref:Cytochrome P450 n=1 Tax=Diploscapter pachys TaxID=2018661 RepID=A0A2A2J8F2_9BILA|nr:hypothetical protein WR25_23815 [Diploscapter pachys]